MVHGKAFIKKKRRYKDNIRYQLLRAFLFGRSNGSSAKDSKRDSWLGQGIESLLAQKIQRWETTDHHVLILSWLEEMFNLIYFHYLPTQFDQSNCTTPVKSLSFSMSTVKRTISPCRRLYHPIKLFPMHLMNGFMQNDHPFQNSPTLHKCQLWWLDHLLGH